ncbi:MAG: OpgC domain-containing protein [Verrucomicrobiota bacterium]|nr:OpgC domain-containing protein [Verrucomicrobiota bacterium]
MEAKPSSPLSPSARDVRLDAFRGVLLLCMTSNHLGSPLTRFTVEPLGFVSSAEGFVFLAGYLAGVVYSRHLETEGDRLNRRHVWHKAGQIYLWHLCLLAVGLAVAFYIGDYDNPISNIFTLFYANPVQAMTSSVLLAYQPPLFDILPLYIMGLVLTPVVLSHARRRGWGWPLFLSFACWAGAQCGIKPALLGHVKEYWIVWMGAFDCFAWQFLWVGGLALGTWRYERLKLGKPWHVTPLITVPSLLLGGWLLAVRQQWIDAPWVWDYFPYILDKWTLAPLRLLNMAALVILFIGFVPERLPRWMITPLALLGRHSLQVFCFQIVAALAAMSLIYATAADEVQSTLITLATMGSLYLPAWLCECKYLRRRNARVQQS